MNRGNPLVIDQPVQRLFGPPPAQGQLFGQPVAPNRSPTGGLFGGGSSGGAGLFAGLLPGDEVADVNLSDAPVTDADSPFNCPVCCNEYSTSDKQKLRRPYSYECGHTTCHGCIQKNKNGKCPFCSKPTRTQTRNYSLEQALDWAKEQKSGGGGESELYKNQVLCLDCLTTFDPNQKLLFSKTHDSHKCVPLKDKDPATMKKVFWLLKVVQDDGVLNLDRAEGILTILLNIVDSYMEAMLIVRNAMASQKQQSLSQLMHDTKLFMNHDRDPKKYQNKKLFDSLMAIRDIEVDKAFKIFHLAKDCSIPQSEFLTSEFFDDLQGDEKAFVPVGVPDKYIGLFPLLNECGPQVTQEHIHRWSSNWLSHWLQKSSLQSA